MVGLIAVYLPQVLGGGYSWMQAAIDGRMAVNVMAALVFAKIVATSFTISSGGSGGVFAPSLFIGSMLGGAFGITCHTFFPHIVTEPSAFVIVGMGGFFAGVAKVPIAALIMVAEMTGGYSLIVPMMIVSSLAYLLLGNVSLYEKQVAARVDSPAHMGDFAVDIMDHLRVRDAVAGGRKFDTLPEDMPFEQILTLMLGSSQQDFPVVDKNDKLTGIISMTDLREAMADRVAHSRLSARDISMTTGVMAVKMDDTLNEALRALAVLDVRELPVVDEDDPGKVIALVGRKEITGAYHTRMEALKTPSHH